MDGRQREERITNNVCSVTGTGGNGILMKAPALINAVNMATRIILIRDFLILLSFSVL